MDSTFPATAEKPVTVYYCKADKTTGLTVRLLHDRQVYRLRGVTLENCSGEMRDGNATGKPKSSGARCLLILRSGHVHTIES